MTKAGIVIPFPAEDDWKPEDCYYLVAGCGETCRHFKPERCIDPLPNEDGEEEMWSNEIRVKYGFLPF